MMEKSNSSKNFSKFNNNWLTEYGLEIIDRDKLNGNVTGLKCRFCVIFGREISSKVVNNIVKNAKNTKKPRIVSVVKNWKCDENYLWKSQLFRQHNQDQHATKWGEFQLLMGFDKKKIFLDNYENKQKTLTNYLVDPKNIIVCHISELIVEDIIKQIYCNANDNNNFLKY